MINKESKISLTYTLRGEYLVRKGSYISADIYVNNAFTKNETFKVNKPMKTNIQAEYQKAYVTITLNESFVQMCLDKPEKQEGMSMGRWLRTPLGKMFLQWKKMNDAQKIEAHIKQYVEDMGGEDYSYELI